jgi:hypothetical protein
MQARPVATTDHIPKPTTTIAVRTDGRWRAVTHLCMARIRATGAIHHTRRHPSLVPPSGLAARVWREGNYAGETMH